MCMNVCLSVCSVKIVKSIDRGAEKKGGGLVGNVLIPESLLSPRYRSTHKSGEHD